MRLIHPLETRLLTVREPEHVSRARRHAVRLAQHHGFVEMRLGELALVVSEAASNIVRHGGGGEMVLSVIRDGVQVSVDVLALDRGPGIAQMGRALLGGWSTAGGLGEGLGAMRRLSDQFEIYAPSSHGTVAACRLASRRLASRRLASRRLASRRLAPRRVRGESGPPRPSLPTLDLGAVCRAMPGEDACGDGWAYRLDHGGRGTLLVVDGLGHGPLAAEARAKAIDALAVCGPEASAASTLEVIHHALAETRGAAAVVVRFDPAADRLETCGLGNIYGQVLHAGRTWGVVSLDGIVGVGEPQFRSFEGPWPQGALLVVQSDGLSSRWDLLDYPGLRLRHPALVSGILYRDYERQRDDAVVVAVRRPRT